MIDVLAIVLSLSGGMLVGLVFFGGLWWTLRALPHSRRPAQLFLGSFLLRTVATLAGLYVIAAGSWQRLLIATLGFVLARMILIRRLNLPHLPQEVSADGA